MIGRVRDRATFEALRRHGRRARRGPVTVVYMPADTPPACVAFAINRKVGGAVVRNKLRRRLRSIFAELARPDADAGASSRLPPGTYLVSVRPEAADLAYRDLAGLVEAASSVAAAGPAKRAETRR